MHELAGKKVTVMGLGLHGGALGTIEWLEAQGADITVTDTKTKEQLQDSLDKLRHYPDIRFVLGDHKEEDFERADMIIRNPSVPKNSPYLEKAKSHGIPIEMDSSLFFAYAPTADIVGVTGSKGKTTTANAIAAVLKYFNPQTVAVGVDGVSPLGELSVIQEGAPVVFELSSWRLEPLIDKTISPHIAVVTSLYRDHLNTYDSFEEYIETKRGLVKFQIFPDIAILNWDDERLKTWETPARRWWYSIEEEVPGDGIFVRNGIIVIRHTENKVELFPVSSLPSQYSHEARNMLPALLIGYLRGMAPDELLTAIGHVHRLPHRLENVAEINGVAYINDSAATMPDATIAALSSLSQKPIIHIVGGSDKNLLFEELAKAEKKVNLRALVFLPGTATERMKEEIMKEVGDDVPVYMTTSMEEAVTKAKEVAQGGDVVLLSPGATSFGLFLHEFDRGNTFRKAVHALG